MLRIHAFGELEVELNDAPVALPPGRRVRSLLAWLALHPGAHSRARVAGTFWPEVPEANARANLRSAVWSLRAALGPAAAIVRTDRETIELCRNDLWVDVLEFDRLCTLGRGEDAVAMYGGELLACHDEEWVLQARDEYGRRLSTALAAAARSAESRGDMTRALERARQRAGLLPLDEDAGRELIRLLGVSGDIPAAIVAFGQLRTVLRDELDIEPSSATRAVVDRLRHVATAAAARGAARTG